MHRRALNAHHHFGEDCHEIHSACRHSRSRHESGIRPRVQGRFDRNQTSVGTCDTQGRERRRWLPEADQHRHRAGSPGRRQQRQRGQVRDPRDVDGQRRHEDASAAERHRDQAGADGRAQARLLPPHVRRREGAVREGQARQGHAGIREGRQGRRRIRGRGSRRHAEHGPRHGRHGPRQDGPLHHSHWGRPIGRTPSRPAGGPPAAASLLRVANGCRLADRPGRSSRRGRPRDSRVR